MICLCAHKVSPYVFVYNFLEANCENNLQQLGKFFQYYNISKFLRSK